MKISVAFSLSFTALLVGTTAQAQTIIQIPDSAFTGSQINDNKAVVGRYGVSGPYSTKVWQSGSFSSLTTPSGFSGPSSGWIGRNGSGANVLVGSMNGSTSAPAWFDWTGTSYLGSGAGSSGTNLTQFRGMSVDAEFAIGYASSPTGRGWVFTRPTQPDNSHRKAIPYFSTSLDTTGTVEDINNDGTVLAASYNATNGWRHYIARRGLAPNLYTTKIQIPNSSSFGSVTNRYFINDSETVVVRTFSTSTNLEYIATWSPLTGFVGVPHPSSSSVHPADINNAGDICGRMTDATTGTTVAFIYRKGAGTFTDVSYLIPGYRITNVASLNDNNDALVHAQDIAVPGIKYTFILDYP